MCCVSPEEGTSCIEKYDGEDSDPLEGLNVQLKAFRRLVTVGEEGGKRRWNAHTHTHAQAHPDLDVWQTRSVTTQKSHSKGIILCSYTPFLNQFSKSVITVLHIVFRKSVLIRDYNFDCMNQLFSISLWMKSSA